MSTCQGAPAPHKDCPHGARCDWQPPARKTLTALAMLGRGVPEPPSAGNRAARRAAAKRKR